MYRVIIIDDEEIVREGMRRLVPWEKLGLTLVATAEDGVTGLEKIKEYEPHIVLLDINMPRKNGLVLAEEITKTYPDMKIIILTGYDEFDYARTALRLGVADYVLKPITKKELIALLEKITSNLERQNQQIQETTLLKKQMVKSKKLLREQFVSELIRGEINLEKAKKRCESLDIPVDSKLYGFFLIEADKMIEKESGIADKANQELTLFAIENMTEEILNEKKCGFICWTQEQIGVVYYGQADKEKINYQMLMEELRQQIEAVLNVTVTIGAGQLVEDLTQLKLAYESAKDAIGERFFIEGDKIIYGQSREKVKSLDVMKRMTWEQELIESIKTQNIRQTLDKIGEDMKILGLERSLMNDVWEMLALTLLKRFLSMEIGLHEKIIRGVSIDETIKNCKTCEAIKVWIENLYEQCKIFIEQETTPTKTYKNLIQSFIESHYQVSDLSMKMVCDTIHISPSHFSNIFKKEFGTTFIQYLTEFRMNQAAYLITHTALKTYEISEKVGYNDPHYFGAAFKKYFKITPSQYKKQCEIKEKTNENLL
jgi:two-component system response regulator YesN